MSNPKSREFPSRKDGSSGSIRNSSGTIRTSGGGKKSPFQKNSTLIFAGIGGGVLLIVIIAIAMSGGSPPPREEEVSLRRPQARVAPPTAVPSAVAPTTPRVTPRTNTVSTKTKSDTEPDTPVEGTPETKTGSDPTPSPFSPTKPDANAQTPSPAALVAPFDAPAAQQKQKEWARFLQSPVDKPNSIGMMMVLIPAGTFSMGMSHPEVAELRTIQKQVQSEYLSAGDQLQEQGFVPSKHFEISQPAHTVTLSKPIYMATTETTRGDFGTFLKETNYAPIADGKRRYGISAYNPTFLQTSTHPVVRVTWEDANAFCEWLSKKEKEKYRLPTEAEWEFAARAGTTTLWPHGNQFAKLQEIGNVSDAIREAVASRYSPRKQHDILAGFVFLDGYLHTAPVGEFVANPFGLHDMQGNVWEWCSDGFDPEYYRASPATDPKGPASAKDRSVRGGSWYTPVRSTVCGYRLDMPPLSVTADIGFRVIREINVKPAE